MIRRRLILSILGIAILLVIPAIYSLTQLNSLQGIASSQRLRHGEAYLAMGGLQARLAELDRLQRTYVIDPDPRTRADMRAVLDSAGRRLGDLDDAGYGPASRPVAESVLRLAEATDRIERLAAAERLDEATNYFETVKPSFETAQIELHRLYTHVDSTSRVELITARAISAAALLTTFIALVVCAAIAFGLGAWTTRELTTPVVRLSDSMALVADGEFRVPENLPYDRGDEIGSVSRSFRSMTRRLVELDRLKAEFMSISTHELKTPINVISGYAELLQDSVYGELSDKQQEALASIREQTRVLTMLVNQLLDISRLEAGGMRLHIVDIGVPDLFRRVARSFQPLAARKDIQFLVDVDPSAPASIPGDPDRIADQVLGNLLSNALKFTPEGGRIAVRAWSIDERLAIEVADTGPGIAADQLPHIFDKFFQVGDQARRKGAGLGLAIAHEVMSAHGGTITAASEPGRGTTFRVTLPTGQDVPLDAEIAVAVREEARS